MAVSVQPSQALLLVQSRRRLEELGPLALALTEAHPQPLLHLRTRSPDHRHHRLRRLELHVAFADTWLPWTGLRPKVGHSTSSCCLRRRPPLLVL